MTISDDNSLDTKSIIDKYKNKKDNVKERFQTQNRTYFENLVKPATQLQETVETLKKTLGGPPVPLAQYVRENPLSTASYQTIQGILNDALHLSKLVMEQQENANYHWQQEKLTQKTIERVLETERWWQYFHKTLRWLVGIILTVVLYSAIVVENKPAWLDWIKIPGVHTIEKFTKN